MLFLLSSKFRKDSSSTGKIVDVFRECKNLGCDVAVTFDRDTQGVNLLITANDSTKNAAYASMTRASLSVEVL